MVTVIIPTIDRPTLSATLKSVHNQSFRNFDVLIVDDSVEQQLESNSFKIIRTGGSHGVSLARNLGLQHVSSEFVALLDDDDEWHPGYLEKQMINFKNLEIDFGLTGAVVNGRKRPRTPLKVGLDPFEMLYGRPHLLRSRAYLPTSSYMFRAEIIQTTTFDESIADRENLRFVRDCFKAGYRIFQDSESLVTINYDSRSSISRINFIQEIEWANYLMSLKEEWANNFLIESARNLIRNHKKKDAQEVIRMINAQDKTIYKVILKILAN